MPVGGAGAVPDELIRRVRVVRGKLPFHLECRPAFDYARAAHQLHIGAHGARFDGPGLSLGLAAPVPLQPDGDGVVADFTLGEGEKRHVRPAPPRSRGPARTLPRRRRGGRAVPRHRRLLAALALEVHLHRPLAGDGPPLRPDAQAPVLRADGGHRRGPDLQPARGDRRRAQLGLPLHLDPRRRVHAVRPAAHRLHRGGGPLPGLAEGPLARRRRHWDRPLAAHVRHRRPGRTHGGDARPPGGLPRLAAGADRQRGVIGSCSWTSTAS